MKKENASDEAQPDEELRDDYAAAGEQHQIFSSKVRRQTIIICGIIFFVALGCRLLSWQDNRFEARKVQTAVTDGYKHTARLLQQGGIRSFFSADSPLSDPNHLGHPPGYPIIIAVVFSIFGESDSALQVIQILADAAAAIVVFFIALSLLNKTVAIIAGALVALAPQFTYNSVLLLPDTLAVLPILLAVLFFILGCKRPRLATFIIAGALIGLSCWLRANALLLAPLMAAIIPILLDRGRRMRYALAIVGGAVLVIAPLTIRNYIVYDHFIPVSLGAGQTLLEGIADYDPDGTLGIPNTDMGIMKWEAEIFQRPDYYGTLFNPDGVQRERQRLAHGFGVIRSHPFWFFGVMVRRAGSMLRLERVRIVSADPPVSHSTTTETGNPPVWSASAEDILTNAVLERSTDHSPNAIDPLVRIRVVIRGPRKGDLLTSPAISIASNTDYVMKVPMRIEQGRVILKIVGVESGHIYGSNIVETEDWKPPAEQPQNVIEIPFVSGNQGQVKLEVTDSGERLEPLVEIGQVELYSLGPASFSWTRFPRALVRLIQRFFITAVMLPLAIIGLALLVIRRNWKTIAFLLVVPVYFLCIQSALHTEYRYVLAIHYFLFVFVAVVIDRGSQYLLRAATSRRFRKY